MLRRKQKNSYQKTETNRLITLSDPRSPISEAYRSIRTNLKFASIDDPLKTILITSAAPDEGKSTTIANLAVVLAQEGNHVLILDADFRKPVQHKIWQMSNTYGLTNILIENTDYRLAIKKTKVPDVELLVTGPKPPNPTELLASRRMADFLRKVSEDYDYVLIDAPPVLPIADALILAHIVDGLILVIGYGTTTYEIARQTKEQLQKASANIVGVIVNNVPTNDHGYYYYYSSYYDEDDKKRKRKHKKDEIKNEIRDFETNVYNEDSKASYTLKQPSSHDLSK